MIKFPMTCHRIFGSTFAAALTVMTVVAATPQAFGACFAPPMGTIAWWPLDGNTDDFVSGNTATTIGKPVFTNGLVGAAMFFDGTGDGRLSTPPNAVDASPNTRLSS